MARGLVTELEGNDGATDAAHHVNYKQTDPITLHLGTRARLHALYDKPGNEGDEGREEHCDSDNLVFQI